VTQRAVDSVIELHKLLANSEQALATKASRAVHTDHDGEHGYEEREM
jgi:hypothetical protein